MADDAPMVIQPESIFVYDIYRRRGMSNYFDGLSEEEIIAAAKQLRLDVEEMKKEQRRYLDKRKKSQISNTN